MTEEDLLRLGRQVEGYRQDLRCRGDESHEAWLMYRQTRCLFLSLAAVFYGTPEAHQLAADARRAVLDFEAVLV